MLDRLRGAFSLDSVVLLERGEEGWTVRASAGPPHPEGDVAQSDVQAGPDLLLRLNGPILAADDQRLLTAFAAQVALVVDRIRLVEAAAAAQPLAEANKMRTALLAAVGHDLRTPLAAAKASVSSLLSEEIELSQEDRLDLLHAADESLDRLAALVDNLLDVSRFQAGALSVDEQPTVLDEVVARTLVDLGADGNRVVVEISDDVPLVHADGGLLERVLANPLANALRYAPTDSPPRLSCSALGDLVQLRVVDCGPGIPSEQWDDVFVPFQRLGTPTTAPA